MLLKCLGLLGFLSLELFASNEGVTDYLNGAHGYYEMRLEAISAVESITESPAKAEFLKTIERSKRVFDPHLSRDELYSIFNKHRGEYTGNCPVSSEAAKALSWDEVLEEFLAFYDLALSPLKEEFMAAVDAFKARRLEALEEASTLGEYRTSTLRNFLNKQILGLTGRPTLDGAEELFQALKAIGFLRTSIPSTVGYHYSQTLAAREFLEWHVEVTSLILGCGSFLQRDLGILVFRQEEGGCGMCARQHHVSKGEMTVSLMDQLDYTDDTYNEEGSGSDVVGNVMSREFWEGVLEGLGGRRLPLIEDHSFGGLVHKENIDLVHQTLAEDGELKVWEPSLESSPDLSAFTSYYGNLGFTFKGLNGEYVVFGR